ncbi:hypothetical protein LP420_36575 [Massilia sp. B-10]|nr:hypothetical protein LP420_36575 [Massilia sp. B-10]
MPSTNSATLSSSARGRRGDALLQHPGARLTVELAPFAGLGQHALGLSTSS